MNVFHYTSIESWKSIKKGSWQSGDKPGLGANLRVCTNYREAGASNGAVFGLLEPAPDEWVNSAEFPVAWRSLMRNVGSLLLSYELSEELVANSFVIDWSHRERILGGHKDDLGKQMQEPVSYDARVRAEQKYWDSRRPMGDYIDNPGIIADMVLPEVITMCHVPMSAIQVSDYQPKARTSRFIDRELLRLQVAENTELHVFQAQLEPRSKI